MHNLKDAERWVRETAKEKGINEGNFKVISQPVRAANGTYSIGLLRVWNKQKEIALSYNHVYDKGNKDTDQEIWTQKNWEEIDWKQP